MRVCVQKIIFTVTERNSGVMRFSINHWTRQRANTHERGCLNLKRKSVCMCADDVAASTALFQVNSTSYNLKGFSHSALSAIRRQIQKGALSDSLCLAWLQELRSLCLRQCGTLFSGCLMNPRSKKLLVFTPVNCIVMLCMHCNGLLLITTRVL